MVEECLVHPAMVTLQPVGAEAVVFVQIEGDYPARNPSLPRCACGSIRGICRQASNPVGSPSTASWPERVAFADGVGDHPGDVARYVFVLLEPVAGDMRGGDLMGGSRHGMNYSPVIPSENKLFAVNLSIIAIAGRVVNLAGNGNDAGAIDCQAINPHFSPTCRVGQANQGAGGHPPVAEP